MDAQSTNYKPGYFTDISAFMMKEPSKIKHRFLGNDLEFSGRSLNGGSKPRVASRRRHNLPLALTPTTLATETLNACSRGGGEMAQQMSPPL